MNVNMKLVNSSYQIIGLSTCVLNDNDEDYDSRFGKESVVNITENLLAVAKYEMLESDIFTPAFIGDYESHYFTITYLRDGKIVDSISYIKNLGEKKFGSLANPDLDKNLKLSLLNAYGPNIISKFKLMRNRTELTNEEIEAIVAKSNELKSQTEKTKTR